MKRFLTIVLSIILVLSLSACINGCKVESKVDKKIASITSQLISKEFRYYYNNEIFSVTISEKMQFSNNGEATFCIWEFRDYNSYATDIVFNYEVKKEAENLYYVDLTVIDFEHKKSGAATNDYKIGGKEKFYIDFNGDSITMLYNDNYKLKFE